MEYLKKITDVEPLKISKYASFIERDSGDIIIYSSLSGVILTLFEEWYINELHRITSFESIPYDANNNLINILYEKKYL